MIARYTRPEMGNIWEEENKYKIWLEIELLACEAQENLGLVPIGTAQSVREKAQINVDRINEIELTTKHDVIAFLTSIEEYAGEQTRFIHLGMTSSDVLDTCFAVQSKQAGELIIADLEKLAQVLKRRAVEHKYTVCVGRSHGIHAEATTFGLKFALWYDECQRNIKRMKYAVDEISTGMISGAVGTYEHLDPSVEEYTCEKLGLKAANVSTQVIQRDIHSQYITTIAIIGSMLEKMAIEVRHLQRTEVLEAEEYFSKGQKGSSAMPHKRNPITSENICGQARIMRGAAMSTLENNALWHERDISHSSVERVVFPDATISLDYSLNKMINLMDNLLIYPEKMLYNLNLTNGLIHSQKVLLYLANKGLKRQTAYVMVQSSAMRTWSEKIPFIKSLTENSELMQYVSEDELSKMFSYERIFKSVDYILKKCGIQ